ncbi:hypothetical protein [Tenacibaculum singaporense]|uniref:Bacteriocin-type signal sequence-containing protein n=1 Tax=Tenacibaculum singaporense TaxID=2358479 RepID=A0A3Q8RMJ7_9FLAO|nr:hypothetical protein [Tenacibaculum singaporense]AZJ35155.1 hypothetical protein D6T69_06310 [Tenacibaculum singaporense]
MKKSILNLGKTLNKIEQTLINGGKYNCFTSDDCDLGCCNTANFCQTIGSPNAGGLPCKS